MTDNLSAKQKAQYSLVATIVAIALVSIVFRILAWQQLNHTSLLFIGIPAILAIVVAWFPPPKSATGAIIRVITLALLIAGVAFGEAFVCILFAAPLFYGVGIVIGLVVDLTGRRGENKPGMNLRALFFIVLTVTPASLEGVVPGFGFERDESVSVTRLVDASPREITALLGQAPRFDRALPWFLTLGFPQPGRADGAGLNVGDIRRIEFVHGRHPGVVVFKIDRSEQGAIDFAVASDDSYIIHWLSWTRSEVRWREAAPGRTRVTWTLTYRRRLDPAWYFKPLERHGVRLAAGYLIDTLATPPGERQRAARYWKGINDPWCRPVKGVNTK